ncbi:MAG TPA: hypothetical protein VFJ94_00075 [Intrasporangium sp.]|uniref:hypothetical protein n=1 Tax=Intrasporangium sp. TaxID=1925024 RepID=UPI002D79B60F|nr:hypothetical protein [Intrasporangium sp.]HET7396892.1 hypothetical protein [Intrasporangium sp.]
MTLGDADSRARFDRAFAPVLADLAAEPVVSLQREAGDGRPAFIWLTDSSGGRTGVPLDPQLRGIDAVVWVAGIVQDAAVDALWAVGEPAVWPVCRRHPASHPMNAALVGGVAVWQCPVDLVAVAEVGQLGEHPREGLPPESHH